MNTSIPQNQRVVSGMRPTGKLHLGHYHGVLKNWVEMQLNYECFFFVADWHALTTHYDDPSDTPTHVEDMVIDWLAAGISPSSATIFLQSEVPEHAELHLLLSMITPLSWLERVPTYKDQQEKLREKDLATYGFLGYPLLQSADILLYKADMVPVGEDQVAHVELTREVARRFNHMGKIILPEPEAKLTKASKMPGLDGQKMSKSYGNTIGLREEPDVLDEKIRKMPTDPARVRLTDPGDPEKCPVWELHKVYSDDKTLVWVNDSCRSAAHGCLDCKRPLIDAVQAEMEPIRERARQFENDRTAVRAIINEGSEAARDVARETLDDVVEAMRFAKN
ncbi:UNVERIFIED_CONTAM: hypothetical protein GTU68_002292 [Idotea baltica]|nr:hypothetical protein [Idotea baltica]